LSGHIVVAFVTVFTEKWPKSSSVNTNEISDWLYIDSGKLVGGYTVRAHYNELSPEQKQEFDRAADFKIGK
jgi:uncharacterized protein YegJ (DUF2314 family)